MTVTTTNAVTGEIIELPVDTPQQIVEAWQVAQELDKQAKSFKDQLKELVPSLIDGENNTSEPIGKFMFRRSMTQRMTYDKATLRRTLDEDLLDTFTVIKKKAVDDWLKENRDTVDKDTKYAIKSAIVPDGNAYEVIKLERILE